MARKTLLSRLTDLGPFIWGYALFMLLAPLLPESMWWPFWVICGLCWFCIIMEVVQHFRSKDDDSQ